MKVVILKSNEIKEVAAGYARNYLFPKNLAIPATDKAVAEAEKKQAEFKAIQEETKVKEEAALADLKDKKVEIKAKANEDGGLFAALSEAEVKKAINLPEIEVEFPEPIKKTGSYEINVKTPNGARGKVNVEILPEK